MHRHATQLRARAPRSRGNAVATDSIETESDRWPETAEEQSELIVRIDGLVREWLVRREHDPVRRDRIADAASWLLLKKQRSGRSAPERPWAWARSVVENLRRSRRKIRRRPNAPLEHEPSRPWIAPEDEQQRLRDLDQEGTTLACLHENLDAICDRLPPHQTTMVRACCASTSVREACRVFDLDRRHFDRDLGRAGRALRPLILEFFGGKAGTVPPPPRGWSEKRSTTTRTRKDAHMRIALATPDEWDSPPEALLEFEQTTFTSWQPVDGKEASSARVPRCRPASRSLTRLSPAERRAIQGDRVSIQLCGRWPILGRVLRADRLDLDPSAFANAIPYFFYN